MECHHGIALADLMRQSVRPEFHFASPARSRELLTRRDDFIQRLSPFDRSARVKTEQPVSETEFLRFVGSNIQAWNQDQERVQAALDQIQERIEGLNWPDRIELIRTSGREEGNAPYTRGHAIILPDRVFDSDQHPDLKQLLLHELFHILSRGNPALKTELYAGIGFSYCREITLPDSLKSRKITNPDAPMLDFCIQLNLQGQPIRAVPVLFSKTPSYSQGGEFFDYLSFQFLLLESDGSSFLSVSQEPGYRLADPGDVTGFFEQVGRNTDYVLHPEEILADNFALLMLEVQDVPSPEILFQMKEILS